MAGDYIQLTYGLLLAVRAIEAAYIHMFGQAFSLITYSLNTASNYGANGHQSASNRLFPSHSSSAYHCFLKETQAESLKLRNLASLLVSPSYNKLQVVRS